MKEKEGEEEGQGQGDGRREEGKRKVKEGKGNGTGEGRGSISISRTWLGVGIVINTVSPSSGYYPYPRTHSFAQDRFCWLHGVFVLLAPTFRLLERPDASGSQQETAHGLPTGTRSPARARSQRVGRHHQTGVGIRTGQRDHLPALPTQR